MYVYVYMYIYIHTANNYESFMEKTTQRIPSEFTPAEAL